MIRKPIGFPLDETISVDRAEVIALDTQLNVNCPNVTKPNKLFWNIVFHNFRLMFPTMQKLSRWFIIVD